MNRKIIVLTALCCSIFSFFTCMNPASGNGSDVGNARLTGRLVDGRAGTPACGALVRVYPVYASKMAKALGKVASGVRALDSTISDYNGEYRFDTLDPGIYSLDAILVDGLDTLTMRHPSVVFVATKDLGCDTLQLPGVIKGKVVVPSDESARNITCYIPGTSYIAITNDTGGFRITGIPAGIYSLSITSVKYNDTTFTGIRVTPSHETDIGPITLGLNRSKNEHDVWGVFDSANDCTPIARIEARVSGDSIPADKPRVYSLDWRPLLNGYSGFIYLPQGGFFWTVDIWVFDSLGRRTGAFRLPNINRATGDIEVPPFNPFNSVPVIKQNDTIVSIKDTIRLNPSISILKDDSVVSMTWQIGKAAQGAATQNKDTVIVAPNDSGSITAVFTVVDRFRNTVSDTVVVYIVTDAPAVSLGHDTLISAGTILTVTADVQQQFGAVVRYYWNFMGDPTWNDSGNLPSKNIPFNQLGEKNLICAVTDDDGNVISDTIKVLAVTKIGGVLQTHTILRESSSPYLVTQNLVVPGGGSLTLGPGTTILCCPDVRWGVSGNMTAAGTASRKIVISALDSTRPWSINVGGGAMWKLTNCDFRHGRLASDTGNCPAEIVIDSCNFYNVDIDLGPTPHPILHIAGVVENCVFRQCPVTFKSRCWRIERNHFTQPQFVNIEGYYCEYDSGNVVASNYFSGGPGLWFTGGGKIINNTITDCEGIGIYISGSAGGSAEIVGNKITKSKLTGVQANRVDSVIIRHNEIKDNGLNDSTGDLSDLHAGIAAFGFGGMIDSNTIVGNSIGVICSNGMTLAYNNIFGNRDLNYRVPAYASGTISAAHNWWGTTDTTLIQTKIWNVNDDPGADWMIMYPIAVEPIPGAGP